MPVLDHGYTERQKKKRIHPDARQELLEAAKYYREYAGGDIARAFAAAFAKARGLIEKAPEHWRTRPHGTRTREGGRRDGEALDLNSVCSVFSVVDISAWPSWRKDRSADYADFHRFRIGEKPLAPICEICENFFPMRCEIPWLGDWDVEPLQPPVPGLLPEHSTTAARTAVRYRDAGTAR